MEDPVTPMAPIVWSHVGDVKPRMVDLGICAESIHLPDISWAIPDRDWLLGPFYNWHADRLRRLGLDDWTVDWDCNKFSRSFVSATEVSHALAQERRRVPMADRPESMAVFEFWYFQQPETWEKGHAIVFAFVGTTGHGEPHPIWIEPQPQAQFRVLNLTKEEIRSCKFVR